MAIEHSRNLLVKIGNGASPTELFNDLGTQSNGQLSLDADRIDTSNKTTFGWRSGLAGLRNFVITADGFANWPDTNGLDLLMREAIAGNDFSGRIVLNAAGDRFDATVQATALQINGANNNATQWSTTWELSQGAPHGTPSP